MQKEGKSMWIIQNKTNYNFIYLYISLLSILHFFCFFCSFCSCCCSQSSQDIFILITLSWGTMAMTWFCTPFTDRCSICVCSNCNCGICCFTCLNDNNIIQLICCGKGMAMFIEVPIFPCLLIVDSFHFKLCLSFCTLHSFTFSCTFIFLFLRCLSCCLDHVASMGGRTYASFWSSIWKMHDRHSNKPIESYTMTRASQLYSECVFKKTIFLGATFVNALFNASFFCELNSWFNISRFSSVTKRLWIALASFQTSSLNTLFCSLLLLFSLTVFHNSFGICTYLQHSPEQCTWSLNWW